MPINSFPPFLSFTVYINSRHQGVTILLHSSYAPFPGPSPVGQNGVRQGKGAIPSVRAFSPCEAGGGLSLSTQAAQASILQTPVTRVIQFPPILDRPAMNSPGYRATLRERG